MPAFYLPECHSETAFLPPEESRHAIRSLRLLEGDLIEILNGRGDKFTAEITFAESKRVEIRITGVKHFEEVTPKLHLAVSPLKFSDRFETLVEKAAEFGVSSIHPVICERSERKNVNTDRLNRILISGIKQSGNPYLPVIHQEEKLQSKVETLSGSQKFVAHLSEDFSSLSEIESFDEDVYVFIGPEGGFTDEEFNYLREKGVLPIDLGQHILRAESAAMAVSAYFHMIRK